MKEYSQANQKINEGKYLNGKRNGKGKEFYHDNIMFEGEYLNGKRNGKGKEYNYESELIFEGEYLNGYKWEGKGYNFPSIIAYELKQGKGLVKKYKDHRLFSEYKYLNGKRNGKSKIYDKDFKILSEGKYLSGEKNGYWKEYN